MKYCYRKVFGGKCDVEKCNFDHRPEGEAEMRKDLGNEGFDKCKKQFEVQQKTLRNKWNVRAKHLLVDKGSGEVDHNRHFNLTAPAHKQGLGLCTCTIAVESEQHNEAPEPGFTWTHTANVLTDFVAGVGHGRERGV